MDSKMNTVRPFALSKAALTVAAAVTSLSLAGTSHAAVTDVTKIVTNYYAGTTSSVNGVSGYGVSYGFSTASNYNINYGGATAPITSLTAGGVTYTPAGMANSLVRRSLSNTDNDQLWFDGTGGFTSSTLSLAAGTYGGFNQVFGGNNTLVGADNLFSSSGNIVGNNTNVDRLDLLFTSGIKTATNTAFAVLDRGVTTDHDAFKIAAITSLSATGTPNGYGTIISIGEGTYGKTDVIASQQEIEVRKNNAIAGDTFHPSDITTQAVGGVLINTSDLAPAGTTIYGYSLFSGVQTGSGSELVNYQNASYFDPAGTNANQGGLDPLGTVAVLYQTSSVPEPTSLAAVALLATGFLGRRSRKTA